MADHHPPPPRLLHLRSATQILHQTTTIIFSSSHHLLIFLILSFLLFSLRTNVENLTHFITTHIDNDPEIGTLLSRIKTSPKPTSHRQLTPFRILEDDYFFENDELDNRFLRKSSKLPKLNVTSFILDSFHPQFGFSNFVSDNGIKVSEIVRSTVTTSFRTIEIIKKEQNTSLVDDGKNESKTNLPFDLERQDFDTLLKLIGVFLASYGVIILAYVFTHVWVHGVVFVVVVNTFLNRYSRFGQAFELGVNLGSRRLAWYVILRWLVKCGWSRILARFFFGETNVLFLRETDDQYSRFKIFIRLMFLPFSTVSVSSSPWVVKGFEKEIYGFLLAWLLLDSFLSFLFALHAWVAMGDPIRTWREVIGEGCDLLELMFVPAAKLKCLEVIVCGLSARDIVRRVLGQVYASMIQCFVEVYFMVAWMIHYLIVKSMDAEFDDVPFGNRELEAMLTDE